jgi:ArsR family transcriptional regulator, arsenate/arsenite/antimonite-responsive transcriptional repressor
MMIGMPAAFGKIQKAIGGTSFHDIARFIVVSQRDLFYVDHMNRELAARRLAELGNITRLDIFRVLVKAGTDGLSISDIRDHLDIPMSTLSFHLRGLVNTGLVHQEKISRTVICRAAYASLNEVIAFLQDECCKGFPAQPAAAAKRRAG